MIGSLPGQTVGRQRVNDTAYVKSTDMKFRVSLHGKYANQTAGPLQGTDMRIYTFVAT